MALWAESLSYEGGVPLPLVANPVIWTAEIPASAVATELPSTVAAAVDWAFDGAGIAGESEAAVPAASVQRVKELQEVGVCVD